MKSRPFLTLLEPVAESSSTLCWILYNEPACHGPPPQALICGSGCLSCCAPGRPLRAAPAQQLAMLKGPLRAPRPQCCARGRQDRRPCSSRRRLLLHASRAGAQGGASLLLPGWVARLGATRRGWRHLCSISWQHLQLLLCPVWNSVLRPGFGVACPGIPQPSLTAAPALAPLLASYHAAARSFPVSASVFGPPPPALAAECRRRHPPKQPALSGAAAATVEPSRRSECASCTCDRHR